SAPAGASPLTLSLSHKGRGTLLRCPAPIRKMCASPSALAGVTIENGRGDAADCCDSAFGERPYCGTGSHCWRCRLCLIRRITIPDVVGATDVERTGTLAGRHGGKERLQQACLAAGSRRGLGLAAAGESGRGRGPRAAGAAARHRRLRILAREELA